MKAWFTNNWQMKMVSLIFAVAMWLYTAGQVQVTMLIPVKVTTESIIGLPATHRVASITPSEFMIELSGPASTLNALDGMIRPRLELSAAALQAGEQNFPIATTTLGIDAEIHILSTNPALISAIQITIGRVESREMWVQAPILTNVPRGIEALVELDRHRVQVTGAAQALALLEKNSPRIPFQPISLEGADTVGLDANAVTEMRVPLRPDVPEGVQVGEVVAKITLKPVDVRSSQLVVPVQVLASPEFVQDYRVQLAQPQVVLTIRGPSHLLDALDPAQVIASIDVRRPGTINVLRDEPLRIQAPAWLKIDAASVGVTVMRQVVDNALPVAPFPSDAE